MALIKYRKLNFIFFSLITPLILAPNVYSAPTPIEAGIEFSIAKGGRLYDKWFKESALKSPKIAHPSYPESAAYKGKKGADWRCKECHGWDYLGKNGHYQSGKHYTGIDGILAAKDKSPGILTTILKGKVHQFTEEKLSNADIKDLINFIKFGTIDMQKYINKADKKAKGNSAKGKAYFETLCASCHGLNAAETDMPDLVKLAAKNPWEVMHKTLYGQPAEDMPALHALDISVSVDILTYLQKIYR